MPTRTNSFATIVVGKNSNSEFLDKNSKGGREGKVLLLLQWWCRRSVYTVGSNRSTWSVLALRGRLLFVMLWKWNSADCLQKWISHIRLEAKHFFTTRHKNSHSVLMKSYHNSNMTYLGEGGFPSAQCGIRMMLLSKEKISQNILLAIYNTTCNAACILAICKCYKD